jgi:UDP-galactopyranose mutase
VTTASTRSPFEAIVLGAGISGLVSTAVLLEQGATNILLVDEYPHAGGNHIDRSCPRCKVWLEQATGSDS